jgi:hypothetical protein
MGILLGLCLLGFGSFRLWRSLQLRMKGLFTVGTVIDVEMRGSFSTLVVRFKTTRNKSIVFRPGGWRFIFMSSFYRVGASVPILYDPNNPRDAVIYTLDFLWMIPLFFVGLGAVIIYQVLIH